MAAKRTSPPAANPTSFGVKLAVMLCIVGGVIFLRQSFMLPLVGLLPSIVAYITDRVPGRPLFQTVLACNMAGVAYFLIDLIVVHHNQHSSLQHMLQDSKVWFIMYIAAAMGYLIYYMAPWVSLICLRVVNRGRLLHLQSIQDKLRKDWGPTIEED